MTHNRFFGTRADARLDRPGDRDRSQKLPFSLDREALAADLDGGPKGEKPQWPLSCYGAGRNAPRQLLEGPLEQSMEEMRVLCYMAARENKLQDYLQHESTLKAQAQQQTQSILNDLDSALKYVMDGEHQHPNRLDEVAKNASSHPAAGGGFSQASNSGSGSLGGGFGQASGLGSGITRGGFGQPSSAGNGSAFGAPSAPSGPRSQLSGFGAPSQPAGGSNFGQPSKPAFGQPTQPLSSPAFGAPSQPGGGGSAFGSASAMGAQGSAFGKPSQPGFAQSGFAQAPKPAFGAPSQPTGISPFGSAQQQPQQRPNPFAGVASQPSGFAQAGQNQAQQASPFASTGQANGFGAPSGPAAANPFGAKAAAPAFGAPSQPNGNAFAQLNPGTSGFGQPSAPSTRFGQLPAPAATSTDMDLSSPTRPTTATNGALSGFGALQASSTAPAATPRSTNGAFGALNAPASSNTPASAAAHTNGNTVPGIPGTISYTTRGPDGKSLSTWKGRPVTYDREQTPWAPYYTNPQTKKPERIWHPDGIPNLPNPYAEAEPEIYLGDLGKVLKEVYGYVIEREEFGDLMPEVPPKREWVRWDL
ncbi:hypothetical protein LTR35_014774 [Friedmanniomyces endolithicus]|uniref:Uncharacterized protein n=1 Tax=Friedmanniomyces endolithicus TaxID=329885 RepID=A0AAN6FE06_9PEZI|nr:hypothetical protein LTR35_014774 [Friedmanniomyces endolithicus]KAK0279253.1 hypothetical protein LTS00_013526 [Friedmanniomyces endolithicus]KAK0311674.1 hypothetical protein LTR82_014203 [Friedmanniomyces endolithicus]KAK0984515.1 hypothetical protein LTR54_014013 [Friedmanniomyces endolithicus]